MTENEARKIERHAQAVQTPQAWQDAADAWRELGDEEYALVCEMRADQLQAG